MCRVYTEPCLYNDCACCIRRMGRQRAGQRPRHRPLPHGAREESTVPADGDVPARFGNVVMEARHVMEMNLYTKLPEDCIHALE